MPFYSRRKSTNSTTKFNIMLISQRNSIGSNKKCHYYILFYLRVLLPGEAPPQCARYNAGRMCSLGIPVTEVCHMVQIGEDNRIRYPGDHLHRWQRQSIGSPGSASLALCTGNSSVTGEFPVQRPVTRSFDVFSDLRLNKRLNKQSRCRWAETPSRSL